MVRMTAVCLVSFSLLFPVVVAAEPSLPKPDKVVAHLDALYRADFSQAKLKMQIKTEHFQRTLHIDSWTIGEDQALMVIRQPARESGTATLRTAKGLWNYAPRADRLVRIPTSLLSESWMGSHFSNDDLVRDSSLKTDFTAALEWRREGGELRLVVRLTPKPEAPVVYTLAIFVLDGSSWLPLRTEWYDGDSLVRTTRYSDVRMFSGRKLPATLTVIPQDAPSEFTSITYESLDFAAKPAPTLFTPAGLRRAARRR